jgi:CBS domain-containing protein
VPRIDELTVGDVCTESPVVLSEELTVGEAYESLVGEGISGVPVTNAEGDLIGVVSNSDVLVSLAPFLDSQEDSPDLTGLEELKRTPLSTFVQGPPITCQLNTSLKEACQLMTQERIHRLIVVAADEIVGLLSSVDVVRAVGLADDDDDDDDDD